MLGSVTLFEHNLPTGFHYRDDFITEVEEHALLGAMFATGLPQLGESFFTAASIIIAIPTGTQVFCWIATMWSGRLNVRIPMLWILGFFTVFIAGGLTGVMLAAVPLNTQVHDTFFVVAHFHYVLIGGAVFPLFGAFYYWYPKITGRLLSERLGAWIFGLFFVGFNLTFFPMHVLGLHARRSASLLLTPRFL